MTETQLPRQSQRVALLIRSEGIQCGPNIFATRPAFTAVFDPYETGQIFAALKAQTLLQQLKVS
jgi:hypothetical protein